MKLEEPLFSRRDLLNGVMGAGVVGLGAVVGQTVLGYLTGAEVPEPEQIELGSSAMEVLARQRYVLVAYGPRPVMIFQLPDGNLRALSAVCTHGQCNVRYRPKNNDIYCGCHHGRFTAEGVNVPGTPPPRPLRKFHINRRDDGTVIVSAKPLGATAAPERPGDSAPQATG